MSASSTLRLTNGQTAARRELPTVSVAEFRQQIISSVEGGARLAALFGMPSRDPAVQLVAVLAHAGSGDLALASTEVKSTYPAITPDCAQTHWFERELAEQWAVTPQAHPWLKPIRFHAAYRPGPDAFGRDATAPILPSVTDFFRVEGEEIHEVAVGPVHAGVIEPGHFRFQCHGECVLHLEISLGYQHRGVERALVGGPTRRAIPYVETLSGDTTIGHTTTYCQAVEALSGCTVPARAEAIRGIALELERLANHVGDLGALAGDVGYLPTGSFCGRLRGDFLNMSAAICGSRFGRGLVRPGGVAFDIEPPRAAELLTRLDELMRDVSGAIDLLWDTPSVLARFEDTGTISQELALELGLVGPAARASGVARDDRIDFPVGIFRRVQLPVSTSPSGDVFARAWVRWLEVQRSAAFLRAQLGSLPDSPLRGAFPAIASLTTPASVPGPVLAPDTLVVSLNEGWRGEICHVAMTDADGRFAHYKIVDPSFHNWIGLAMALRDQEISDFPLCNKSFNLSYCGHDL